MCVGGPRPIPWRGRTTHTSIWKAPVEGRVHVGRLNVAGDRQSDLRVHGGLDKAVYAYPWEHYPEWMSELERVDLSFGEFGENLTTEGLLEHEVAVGDRLRIGTAELVVTQPRVPCFKLGVRFGTQTMVRRFLRSGRSGFYLSVAQEGEIGAGDAIEVVSRDPERVTISALVALQRGDDVDAEVLRRAATHPVLSRSWREMAAGRLE